MIFNTPELFGTPKHKIMDTVHGAIPMFSHERKIIDHPLFLRLRHIKQNDILQFVFIGASHTRFEHSIGTMHIASRIFKTMMRNLIRYKGINTLTQNQIEGIQYIYGCLRLAALLHDVGHFPFSHQFEESEFGKKVFTDTSLIEALWKNPNNYLNNGKPSSLKHEHFSLLCGIEILKELDSQHNSIFETEDILGIMEKGDIMPSEKFCSHSLTLLKLFIGQLTWKEGSNKAMELKIQGFLKDIISGEIDADKMDYLLRDSFFSGAKYGEYNLDHLINNMWLGWEIKTSVDAAWVGVAIDEKGKGAFEDFVHSRFRMYLHVYNHKTVVNFKWLVRQAILEISGSKEIETSYSNLKEGIISLLDLSDTLFWELFREHSKNHVHSACYYIINRKKLKYLSSLRIDKSPAFEIENKKSDIEKKYNCNVIEAEAPSKFSKIHSGYEKLRLLTFDKITKRPSLSSIHSDFFEGTKDIMIRHYFEDPQF